jgi:hypothetical protein
MMDSNISSSVLLKFLDPFTESLDLVSRLLKFLANLSPDGIDRKVRKKPQTLYAI